MDNATLSLSYNSLWKLLIDRKIIRHQLPEVIDAEYCQIDPNRKDM